MATWRELTEREPGLGEAAEQLLYQFGVGLAFLDRDGRYSMHCFPPPDNEDAVYVTGRARRIDDAAVRVAVGERFVAERSAFDVPFPADHDGLFEFDVDTVMVTRTTGHGDPDPQHTIWHA